MSVDISAENGEARQYSVPEARMINKLNILSPTESEHFHIAKSFSGEFTASQFVERYLSVFPSRNPNSILPSDFSWNNNQAAKDDYPSFLETITPSIYKFVGLEIGQAMKHSHKKWEVDKNDFSSIISKHNFSNYNQYNGAKSYWWVNHTQTYSHEVSGGYLWSPTLRADGARSQFYENMKRIYPGDIVFSYANGMIRAIGVCTAIAALMPKPNEFGTTGDNWASSGWQVPVCFHTLKSPLSPKQHIDLLAPLLPYKYSPLRTTGAGNQGAYLTLISESLGTTLKKLLQPEWLALEIDATSMSFAASDSISASDEIAEQAILNRTDIGETEKISLVKARRGQGVYRKNLEGYESFCRLTGARNVRYLRASHIKPWCTSTDYEKLDGNNGLLLSPHIDHLFDQGYISFTNYGDLLVSPCADQAVLELWGGIISGINCGSFREEQLPYLDYHRKYKLKR